MKRLLLILFLFSNLIYSYAKAISYEALRFVFESGQHHEAITQANTYLELHPNDGDVRLALAQFYFTEKKYQLARSELVRILKQTPRYTDALLILINCDMVLLAYQEALFMVNYGLLFNPTDPIFYKKKADIEAITTPLNPPYPLGFKPDQSLLTPTTPLLSQIVLQPEYLQLKKLYYAQNRKKMAIQRARHYLQLHPRDVDVRLVLGQFYFNQKEYLKAQKEVSAVLQQVPRYKDALLILINSEMQLQRYNQAKILIYQALSDYPHDKVLLKKLKDIEHNQAADHSAIRPQSSKTLKPISYKNEIGLYQQNYSISDIHRIWDYTTLYYGYKASWGKLYVKMNYNQRLGFKATQEEIEAFPKLTQYIYLELQAAIAHEPNLFPTRLYGGEVYVTVPHLLDFSVGEKYNDINKQHQFALSTGSLAKQYEKHRVTYRFNYYDPNAGDTSLLHLLDYRYFLRDPNLYVGVVYGNGTSPDLANLATIDFLVTRNQIISPYINFPLFKERLLINTSFYYQHQVFISLSRVRNWAGGTMRFTWNF